jgi:thiamine pyrophosphate-dependent acetolactate synthase large subunit-like protein
MIPASNAPVPLSPVTEERSHEIAGHTQIDGHGLTALTLRRLGITRVYGIAGLPVYQTFAACVNHGLRVIATRHQQGAGLMAAAQNYLEGRVTAVALVSSGPAVTNLATALLVARDNGWPLVAVGAPRPSKLSGGFQELDAVPVFRPITKFAEAVTDARGIGPAFQHACAVAAEGRPGPVYLELPEDVLQQKCVVPSGLPRPSEAARPIDASAVRRAAELLTQARRPAVLISESLRWSEPYAELAQLIDCLDAPFAASPMGRGYLPDDHPRCYDNVRSFLLSSADAVLLVGAKLDWVFRFGGEIARDARLVQIAIHESEIETNVTPEVSVAGDVRLVLRRLVEQIDRTRLDPDHSWREVLDRKREQTASRWEHAARQAAAISPLRLVAEVRDFLPRDAICVVDGNVTLAAAQHLLPSYVPASRLTPGHNGCMGVGIPFGTAAKLSHPGRMVVVISGDFAFGLNAMEMETAVRLRIPVIVVVANNDGNGGALAQRTYYPGWADPITMFGPGIHYDQMMVTFGGYGEYVDRPEEIQPALARAVQSGLPACINVRIDPESPYPR